MQLIVNGFSSEKKTIAGFGCSRTCPQGFPLPNKSVVPITNPHPLGAYSRILSAPRAAPYAAFTGKTPPALCPKKKKRLRVRNSKTLLSFPCRPYARWKDLTNTILNLEQNHTSQASCCGPSPLFSAAPHPETRPPSCRCRPDSGGMYPCSRTQWY